MKEKLRLLSRQDGLTGIENRRAFDGVLVRECRRAPRAKSQLSLVMIDIDSFRPYNDNNGHQEGDAVLKKVAHSLASSVGRPTDLVARYGGEEFSAVLTETSGAGATKIAESMRSRVKRLQSSIDTRLRLTTSLQVLESQPLLAMGRYFQPSLLRERTRYYIILK